MWAGGNRVIVVHLCQFSRGRENCIFLTHVDTDASQYLAKHRQCYEDAVEKKIGVNQIGYEERQMHTHL